VRILATLLNSSSAAELVRKPVGCHFHFGNGSAPAVVPGKMILHKASDHSSNAIFILCPARHLALEQDTDSLPQSVSILCDHCQGAYTYEVRFAASLQPVFSGETIPSPLLQSPLLHSRVRFIRLTHTSCIQLLSMDPTLDLRRGKFEAVLGTKDYISP